MSTVWPYFPKDSPFLVFESQTRQGSQRNFDACSLLHPVKYFSAKDCAPGPSTLTAALLPSSFRNKDFASKKQNGAAPRFRIANVLTGPTGARTIAGVSTSVTAFVGAAGPGKTTCRGDAL